MKVLTGEDFSPGAIAGSGQCFRLSATGEGAYRVTAYGRTLTIRETDEGAYDFSSDEEEFHEIWREYFDLDSDYSVFRSQVLPGDDFLREAMEAGRGIRILRQEPFETLISFIISQRKSIPAIRTSIERLSEALGERTGEGECAFPAPEALAGAGDEVLSGAGLGYRAPYVREAAARVASGKLQLGELTLLPTDELIATLMTLPGVGIKVASCVSLFAYHRLDTLPVDVWMKRVLDNVYHGALPEEYREYRGLLHQYMFNYARIIKLGT